MSVSDEQHTALGRLRDAQRKVDRLHEQRDELAYRAASLSTPWREIGAVLGITAQAAHYRYTDQAHQRTARTLLRMAGQDTGELDRALQELEQR